MNILSALRENEAYLNSIQGRIDLLTNSFQTLWMNFLDSEVVKFIIDVVNGLVKIVDNVGLLQTAMTLLGGIFVKKKWGDLLFPSKQEIQEKTQELQKAMEQAREKFENNPSTKNRQAKEDAEKNYAAYQESVASNIPEVEKQVKAETKLNETLSERQKLELELQDAQNERSYAWSMGDEVALDAAEERVQKTQAEIDALGDVAEAADDVTDSVVVMGNEGQVAGDKIESGAKKGTKGFKSLATAAKQYLFSMAAMYVVSTAIEFAYEGIKLLTKSMDESAQSAEELHDEYIEASDALSSCASEVSSLESELKTTNDKIEELMSQGTLSFVEQEELERLQSVSAELERQLNITKTLQGSLQTGTSAAAMRASNAYLNTSFGSKESKTERQEAAKEEGSTFGKYAGLILGGVLTAGAIAFTGGLAAIPAAAGWIGVGGMAGSMLGEGLGGAHASSKAGKVYDQEQTVGEAIKSMNETRDKLIQARDEAYEAYASDPGNDKFKEEYSKAADDLATYDETMATRMTQLSQYYNSIMQGWEQAEPEVQETARELGDMIDAYNIEMGGKNAKSNAIDRIFGEEADTKLQSVKAELERMAKAGEEVDLKKAFGGDTEAYDKFVKRLREMGIYVYECEDAFVKLAAAEVAASETSFTDIAKDVHALEDAITGMKDAFEEFMQMGMTSTGTILELKELFKTEETKKAFEEYAKVMLSGTASIAEAREATSKLAQTYIAEEIKLGKLTNDQKQTYIAQLKHMGISNAEGFIKKELQQTGLQEIEKGFDNLKLAPATNREAILENQTLIDEFLGSEAIQEAIKLYGLEEDAIGSLINKLKAKNKLEADAAAAQTKVNDYATFLNGDGKNKGWKQLDDDITTTENSIQRIVDRINSDNSKTGLTFSMSDWNPDDWQILGADTYYFKKTDENRQGVGIWHEDFDELKELYEVRDDALKAYNDFIAKNQNSEYLDENGDLKDGVEEHLKQQFDDAQAAVDNMEKTINATFTVDYDFEFAKPDMINTVTGITEALEQYKSVLEMVNEVAFDGQVISEDYYNALREQIGEVTVGTQDFFDAIDTSNGYVVKNADLLKDLTEQSKKLQQKNVALAKSQARLEYYELVKQMSDYIDTSEGVEVTDATKIAALAEEANALTAVIKKYSLLEHQLLGTSNAYDTFEKAQATDAEVDYLSKTEDMLSSLIQGYQTGDLGTETTKVSMDALIPDSVFEGLKTAEEKAAAAKKYIDEVLALYYDIQYDEDGNFESAVAKFGNARKLIEDGLDKGVFEGADYKNFQFSGNFLEELRKSEDKLEVLAKQLNTSKEVAFAWIQELENKNISWLEGNYGSLIDVFSPQTLENNIYNTTQAISTLNQQLADGTIDAKEYAKQMFGLEGALKEGYINQDEYDAEKSKVDEQKRQGLITDHAYNEVVHGVQGAEEELYKEASEKAATWLEVDAALKQHQKTLDDYNKMLEGATWDEETGKLIDADGQEINLDMDAYTKTYNDVQELKDQIASLEEPTELEITFAHDKTLQEIEQTKKDIQDAFGYAVAEGEHYQWNDTHTEYIVSPKIEDNTDEYEALIEFVALMNKKHTLELGLSEEAKTVEDTIADVAATLSDIATILKTGFELIINDDGRIAEFKRRIDEATQDRTMQVTVDYLSKPTLGEDASGKTVRGYTMANGTAHASGTAYAGGNWGAPQTETALTGELGPELLVRGNRWSLVGENGAEFTQVKKNDIIFNHKQTEEILKNGHITSRGKAYAMGTNNTSGKAYASGFTTFTGASVIVYPDAVSAEQWEGTGYDGPDGEYNLEQALNNIAKSGSSAASAMDDFEESIDWIEIRLEEWDEKLGKLNAELENTTGHVAKNAKIDEIIATNKGKQVDLSAGAAYYEKYAQNILSEVSSQYHDLVKNGAIAIEDIFIAGAGEGATEEQKKAIENQIEVTQEELDAIQKYRDYIQKSADLRQQEEEVITEIRRLAIQQIDNAQHSGDVRATVEASQTEKLQNAVDFDEARGMITDPNYYAAMMENSERTIAYLTEARNNMQREFDDAVADGQLVVGSDEWYENLDKLYQMDAQIDEAQISLEEFQNSINDIYWEGFDELIGDFERISDEAQGFIDILSDEDMFTEPDYDKGWDESDVQWTNEGLATLGLHAQEMERAEAKAQAYAVAIDDLTAEYKAGHYSESEYNEKLAELTKGQMDAIKAAKSEKDAIVDLNKSRVEAIKNGINKQVESYEELIKKKKESLDADKDIYDFQKSVQEQQKDISAIERKIAALRGDNSASAIAQRKKLEAELAEAKAELQETYYERSIENQQTALDNELETFKEAKDKEIETWDKYLEDVETVVAESLGVVKENAVQIGSTLATTASEYNLTISEAILDPWKEGHGAIDTYTKKFGDSVSPTTKALDTIKGKWDELKSAIALANAEADKYYGKKDATADGPSVADINKENQDYYAKQTSGSGSRNSGSGSRSGSGSGGSSNKSQSVPAVGSTVTVDSSATNFGSKNGGAAMASFVRGGSYTVYQVADGQVLIGRNGVYTGWVNLSDLQGYAKGTKSTPSSGIVNVDELGEELILGARNGRLTYLEKGSGVIPADITSNLMSWGELNPQDMLDRNRPSIGLHPEIHNTEIQIDNSIAELIHIDKCDQSTLPDVEKIVNKALDKHMQTLNNSLKRFAR